MRQSSCGRAGVPQRACVQPAVAGAWRRHQRSPCNALDPPVHGCSRRQTPLQTSERSCEWGSPSLTQSCKRAHSPPRAIAQACEHKSGRGLAASRRQRETVCVWLAPPQLNPACLVRRNAEFRRPASRSRGAQRAWGSRGRCVCGCTWRDSSSSRCGGAERPRRQACRCRAAGAAQAWVPE